MFKKILFFFILTFSISSCINIQQEIWLYENKFIVVEKFSDKQLQVNGQLIEFKSFDKRQVLLLMKKFKSKSFLLGLRTEFLVGDILTLIPHITSNGGDGYYIDSNKEVKNIIFVN